MRTIDVKRGRRSIVRALAVGVAVSIVTSACLLAGGQACEEAEAMLVDVADRATAPTDDIPLEQAVLTQVRGYRGMMMNSEDRLTIEEAAATRYDPETLDQLRQLGYTDGLVRVWESSAILVNETAFEFADPAGAIAYQEYVTRYACSFADEAFAAPDGGIGLQLRYQRPPRVRDQISWVEGDRRYVIWTSSRPGSDHQDALEVYEQALARSRGE